MASLHSPAISRLTRYPLMRKRNIPHNGGWATTGRGAELNDRRWLVTERCREYLISAAQRFRGATGFHTQMEGAI